ncbi:MAG: class I SAM-dependent methyltransferase [Natronomonas sp.]
MTSVQEFYGRQAALYDRIATAPVIDRWRRIAARRVASPGATVVEMGCGTGANLPYLREGVGPEGRVLGIDITGPLLELARTRARNYDNVDIGLGDATEPPVCEADAVLATFVCGLFSDPATVVDRWCDLVGPGGRIGLLNATASETLLGQLLNPAFDMFVAAGSPERGIDDVLVAPFGDVDTELSRRVNAARAALADRTIDRRYETFGLGFVGLLTGTVDDRNQ